MTGTGRHRPQAPHWGIVGGGMLGLTLALRLAERGERVTVLEAAPELGGLAAAWTLGDVAWDRHYHVILEADARLRALLAELGLEGEIRWKPTRTGFYVDGAWHSMSNAVDFLRFPPLGAIDKLRLGLTILRAAAIGDGRPLERVLAVDWLRRWSGRRTTEKIWSPLLRAKLGDNHARVSAAFIWSVIARLYAARRAGLKQERMGYVPGGYGRILERFARELRARGVVLETACPAQRLRREAGRVTVESGRGPFVFDRAVVTAPAPLAARLCPDLGADERRRLEGVEYQGIVCASLLLPRSLRGFYVTNVTDAWVPFTGLIEMTALVDPAELGGHHLVYLPRYAAQDDAVWSRSDDEVRAEFTAALARMTPRFAPAEALAFRVSRARHVLPLPLLDYSARLPPMRTTVPGLFLVNSAQIVNGTLNNEQTVELAERAVAAIGGG